MQRQRKNSLSFRRRVGFEKLQFVIFKPKNGEISIYVILIWLWMILLPVFYLSCGGENRDLESADRLIKLIGPVAYKGPDDRMVVEGMVQNTGKQPIENIMVAVSWFDQQKELLAVVENRIDSDILPAQGVSTYCLLEEFDLRMDNYSLMFYNQKKELLSIYHLSYSGP